MNQIIQVGSVLLAEPFLEDPNFKRSAVLLCEHDNEQGSVGFIMNRQLGMPIHELLEDFPEFEADVFFGGPVATDTIHYIHSVGDLLDDSVEVSRGVYWGGDFDKLKFLISSKLIQPEQIRFFLGYAGWSARQLASELELGSWLPTEMYPNFLFKVKPYELWQTAMRTKGSTFGIIAELPDDMSWN